MMGLISEEVDDACKLKNINLTTLESYWENQSKTEQEKTKEVENFVTPIFTEAKNYMLKYIESEWFNKKVEEKIGKGSEYLQLLKNKVLPSRQNKVKDIESTNPNSEELLKAKKDLDQINDEIKTGEQSFIKWDDKQKTDLKSFINGVKLVFSVSCNPEIGGFVISDKYSDINFCTKNMFPSDVNKNEVMLILVHEFNHCLSEYFETKDVQFLPQDAKGPQVTTTDNPNYGNISIENSARVQNLKRLLGVDDFGTLDNFIKLIKDNVKIKSGNNIFNVVYDNNLMKIPFKSTTDVTLLNFNLFINDTNAYDVKMFFNTEAKTVKDQYDSYIEVDLEKLYNYSIEFAKYDSGEGDLDLKGGEINNNKGLDYA
jgi:hypothetical protein